MHALLQKNRTEMIKPDFFRTDCFETAFFATENENAGGREVTCVFVRIGTLNKMNQEIFLSFRRSLSEIIAINSEFVGFPREFWIV